MELLEVILFITEKTADRVCMEFSWNPNTSVLRCLDPLFQLTLFLCLLTSALWGYINPHIRINKMINRFMVFTFLENALNLGIFTHFFLHSKLAPKFLPSHPRQKKITHSPRQHFFQNLFSTKQKEVEESMICFMKIHSENMKMTWGIRLLIFCKICNFLKCDALQFCK